jgi:hypothetical protein
MSKKIPNKNLKSRETSVTGGLLYVDKTQQVFDIKKELWLYRFVYKTRFSLSVVFLLLASFSMQSVERAFADELPLPDSAPKSEAVDMESQELATVPEVEEQTEVASEIIEEVLTVDETTTPASTSTTETVTSESDFVTDFDNSSDDLSAEPPVEIDDVLAEEELLESATTSTTTLEYIDEEQVGEEIITEPTDESSVEDTPAEEIITEPTSDDNSSESINPEPGNSSSTDEIGTSTEATSEVVLETGYETVYVTENEAEFSFSKEECTELATGSFYCLKPQQNQLDDALFSASDEDGDLEIFLIRGGVQVQVTNNQVDDAAPYYDQNSDSLVWHRLVNDTYQIISFDPSNQKETQLTGDIVNNMEPTRQGEYTVWQRWVDGGWNIVLFDGENERQITKNNNHNVAPYIHGSLIVWNSKNQSGDKTIEMYDLESDTYVTVDDPDGLSVSNPRMVFVYDSLHPNGDIITRGYDVMARKFIDLDTLPRDLPEELPPADSTGETRALIQTKPSIKSEIEESLGSSTPNILPPVPLDNASNTDQMTLDLSNSSTTPEIDEVLTNEFDIVIEPFLLSDATTTESVQE